MRKLSIAGAIILLLSIVVGGSGPRWLDTSPLAKGPRWVAVNPAGGGPFEMFSTFEITGASEAK